MRGKDWEFEKSLKYASSSAVNQSSPFSWTSPK